MAAFRMRFDKEKEHVDADLGVFAGDLLTTLESTPKSNKDLRVGLENLLLEARQCATMPASEFWVTCEGIVQKLDDKRQELPMGSLKQAHTRLLFILTRCTRLLQFRKEIGVVEKHVLGMQPLSDLGVYKELIIEILRQPDLLGEKEIQKINEKQSQAGKQDNIDQVSSSGVDGVEVNTGSTSNNFLMSVAEKNLTVNNTPKAKEKSNIQPKVLFPVWRSPAIGQEILAAIRAKFDKEMEHVDADLGVFACDLLTTLESTPESNKELRVGLENLLLEARQCATMPASEFWVKCEGIVHKLDDKRQELPVGGLKQAHTRLLFILTRCTRLVQFRKESAFVEKHILGMRQLSDLGVYKERTVEILQQPDLRKHKR